MQLCMYTNSSNVDMVQLDDVFCVISYGFRALPLCVCMIIE